MKFYSTKLIKNYIEEHKNNIKSVECGMSEDWLWTSGTVFSSGKYLSEFDWNEDNILVSCIRGSAWATPVMLVRFMDGSAEIVECYEDDGVQTSFDRIMNMQLYASVTGGMDDLHLILEEERMLKKHGIDYRI